MTGTEYKRCILAVFAHPDDETFLAGGTLSKYAAAGWKVFLLCATRGEAGRRGPSEGLTPEEFAELRQRELGEACAALGIEEPMFLACADQHLADSRQAASQECVRIMNQLRPEVVITFGPDGVSGHPDHVALSTIVTDAFSEARESLKISEGLEEGVPFQALYYVLGPTTIPKSCKITKLLEPTITTHVIDIRESGQMKLAAAQSYRSQQHLIPETLAELAAIQEEPERFHRAYPLWTGSQQETEL